MRNSRPAKFERPRQGHWLGVALTITALGVAACGGDDGDAAGTTSVSSNERASTAGGGASGEPILIKTRVTIPTGEVLAGSTIGDSRFCPGGTFRDRNGNDDIGSVDRTFRCPDGSLRIGFSPGVPQGQTQAGPWKILSGTGAYKTLRGEGQMKVTFEPGSSSNGRETFPGTVTH
jgi:hypothetical protein